LETISFFLKFGDFFFRKKLILRQNIPILILFFTFGRNFAYEKALGSGYKMKTKYTNLANLPLFFPHLWQKPFLFRISNFNFTFWRNLTRKKQNGCLGATRCSAHRKTSITRAPVVVNWQNWLVVRRIESWSCVSSSSFRELGSDAFITIVESWIV